MDKDLVHTHRIPGVDRAQRKDYKDVIDFKKKQGKAYLKELKARDKAAKHGKEYKCAREDGDDASDDEALREFLSVPHTYDEVQSMVKDPVAKRVPTHQYSTTVAVKVLEPEIGLRPDEAPELTAREHFVAQMAKDGKRFEPADDLRKHAPRGKNNSADNSIAATPRNIKAEAPPSAPAGQAGPAVVVKKAHLSELMKPDGMLPRKNKRGLSLPKVDEEGCYYNIMPGFTKPNFACCFKYEVAMVDMDPPKEPTREEAAVLLPSTDRINLHAVYRYSPWGCPCEACVVTNKNGGRERMKQQGIPLPISSPASDELSATWCSHASYIVTVGGYTVLTDPVWSDRCSPVQMMGPMRMVPVPIALHDMPYVDVVTISHNHYDHLCTTTIRHLCRHNHNLFNRKRRVGKPSKELLNQLEANYDGGSTAATEDGNVSPCRSPLYRGKDKFPTERDPKYRAHTHPIFVVPMGMKQRYFVPLQAEVPEMNLDLVIEMMWWDTADVSAAIYKHRAMMTERMSGGDEDAIVRAGEGMNADFIPPTPPLLVTVVPSQHWSMRQGLWDRDRELWCSFVYRIGHVDHIRNARNQPDAIGNGPLNAELSMNGRLAVNEDVRRLNAAAHGANSLFGTHKWTMYHSGDTGFYDLIYEEIFKAFGAFDFSMIAIGAYEPRKLLRQQHLDPIEAVEIHDRLQSRRSAAMHWGTWILSDEPIDEPPKLLSMAMSEKYRPFMHKLGAGSPMAGSLLPASVIGNASPEGSVMARSMLGARTGREDFDPSEDQLRVFRAMGLDFLNAGMPNKRLMTTIVKAKHAAVKKNAMPTEVTEDQLPNAGRIFETEGVRVERQIATQKPEHRAEVEINSLHPDVKALSEAVVNQQLRANPAEMPRPVVSTIFHSQGHGTTESDAVFHHEIREGMKHLGGRTYPYFDCENPFRVLMHGETWVIPPHSKQPLLEATREQLGEE